MSNDNVVVKFIQSWRGYSKGESAGFTAEQAKALVDGKVAVVGKGAAPKAVAPVAPKAPVVAPKKGSAKKVAASGGAPTDEPNTNLVADPNAGQDDDPDADPNADLDDDPNATPEQLDDEPKP